MSWSRAYSARHHRPRKTPRVGIITPATPRLRTLDTLGADWRMSLALRANAIWKSYAAGVVGCSARVWVLRGASLVVERGECVAILGARGAGTTTLLHCLAGLRRTDAGRIECTLPTRLFSASVASVGEDADGADTIALCDDAVGISGSASAWIAHRNAHRRGATIVATHDLSRVRHTVDRALLLRDGKLTLLDRASGVRRVAERFAARTSGSPPDRGQTRGATDPGP